MSNRYIFRYAAILVIVVAALLSATATLLKPYQLQNQDVEKMMNILQAAGVPDVTNANAQSLFNTYCTSQRVIDSEGNIVDDCSNRNPSQCQAFTMNLKDELYKKSVGQEYQLPVFIIEYDNQMINVIPLQGTGLWGPIWGYIAIAGDYNTVLGTVFDHQSETPGLGGEITSNKFQKQFIGKTIFQNGNFVSITVQKGGIMQLPQQEQQHAVDAISGGTVTSKGVDAMIKNVLSSYIPYFEKQEQNTQVQNQNI